MAVITARRGRGLEIDDSLLQILDKTSIPKANRALQAAVNVSRQNVVRLRSTQNFSAKELTENLEQVAHSGLALENTFKQIKRADKNDPRIRLLANLLDVLDLEKRAISSRLNRLLSGYNEAGNTVNNEATKLGSRKPLVPTGAVTPRIAKNIPFNPSREPNSNRSNSRGRSLAPATFGDNESQSLSTGLGFLSQTPAYRRPQKVSYASNATKPPASSNPRGQTLKSSGGLDTQQFNKSMQLDRTNSRRDTEYQQSQARFLEDSNRKIVDRLDKIIEKLGKIGSGGGGGSGEGGLFDDLPDLDFGGKDKKGRGRGRNGGRGRLGKMGKGGLIGALVGLGMDGVLDTENTTGGGSVAGGLAGGALGSLLGPLGTAIGSAVGSYIGNDIEESTNAKGREAQKNRIEDKLNSPENTQSNSWVWDKIKDAVSGSSNTAPAPGGNAPNLSPEVVKTIAKAPVVASMGPTTAPTNTVPVPGASNKDLFAPIAPLAVSPNRAITPTIPVTPTVTPAATPVFTPTAPSTPKPSMLSVPGTTSVVGGVLGASNTLVSDDAKVNVNPNATLNIITDKLNIDQLKNIGHGGVLAAQNTLGDTSGGAGGIAGGMGGFGGGGFSTGGASSNLPSASGGKGGAGTTFAPAGTKATTVTTNAFGSGKTMELPAGAGGIGTRELNVDGSLNPYGFTGTKAGSMGTMAQLPGSVTSSSITTAPGGARIIGNATGGSTGALISSGEGGYGSYNRGVAGDSKDKIDFSNMTVSELMARQALPKGDPNRIFAFGKYQVIPGTMKDAVQSLGIDPNSKVTPELQENIYRNHLIATKRPEVKDYITGKTDDLNNAQTGLAKEFASVADPSTGRSRYGGVGGNASSITPEKSSTALQEERKKYKENIDKGMSPGEAWSALSQPNSNVGTMGTPSTASAVGTPNVIEKQGQIAGTRRLPIQDALKDQMQFAAEKAGVQVEVGSGGQAEIGSGGPRTGSTRHDNGGAADVKLYTTNPDGSRRLLSMNNPEDAAKMETFSRESVRAGATGIGAGLGYMGPSTLHIGGGKPANWGGAPFIASAFEAGRADLKNGQSEFETWKAQRAALADKTPDKPPSSNITAAPEGTSSMFAGQTAPADVKARSLGAQMKAYAAASKGEDGGPPRPPTLAMAGMGAYNPESTFGKPLSGNTSNTPAAVAALKSAIPGNSPLEIERRAGNFGFGLGANGFKNQELGTAGYGLGARLNGMDSRLDGGKLLPDGSIVVPPTSASNPAALSRPGGNFDFGPNGFRNKELGANGYGLGAKLGGSDSRSLYNLSPEEKAIVDKYGFSALNPISPGDGVFNKPLDFSSNSFNNRFDSAPPSSGGSFDDRFNSSPPSSGSAGNSFSLSGPSAAPSQAFSAAQSEGSSRQSAAPAADSFNDRFNSAPPAAAATPKAENPASAGDVKPVGGGADPSIGQIPVKVDDLGLSVLNAPDIA